MKWIKELWIYIAIIVIVVLLRSFVITPIRVNGGSMHPTLVNGQILLLEKFDKKYHRFDIVVIDYKQENEKIIKRIIGVPGDHITYKDNVLYVNNKKVEENFSHAYMYDFDIEALGSYNVPENTYFVLGDNRTISKDSRYIGFINEKDIQGKAVFSLFPFKTFGKL